MSLSLSASLCDDSSSVTGVCLHTTGGCVSWTVCGQRMVPGSVAWYELRWLSLNSVPPLEYSQAGMVGVGGENKAALGQPGVLEPERWRPGLRCLIILLPLCRAIGLVSLGQARGVAFMERGQQTLGGCLDKNLDGAGHLGPGPLCRDSRALQADNCPTLSLGSSFQQVGSLVVVPASSYQGAVKSRGVL